MNRRDKLDDMLTALRKAEEILEKEPDNDMINGVICDTICYIVSIHDYSVAALHELVYTNNIETIEKIKNKNERLKQKKIFIGKLIKMLNGAIIEFHHVLNNMVAKPRF